MTCVHVAPIDMKCHGSPLFIAAGCSVVAVDLRTVQKIMTAASCEPKLFSAAVLPSKSLICAGGYKKAMIWDTRRNYEAVVELDGHVGPVTELHMDQYKIVTGGPEDVAVMVWEPSTGKRINIIPCSSETDYHLIDAMAVNGTRIAIASTYQGSKVVSFRDFFNATHPVTDCFSDDNRSEQEEHEYGSKFWDPEPYNDDSDIEI